MLLLVGIAAYAGYMNDQRRHIDPTTYQPLLQLIGNAESNNNYNAYYGNAHNTTISFTRMSIAEVMQWQDSYIRQGSPSSAVGRYQIIDKTLEGLVNELKLDKSQKFDPNTQDKMAITLLERRGSKQYANNELSAEEFAANLAKEWAALPKTIGNNPSASYYANDGLNASRVGIPELIAAIKPIGFK